MRTSLGPNKDLKPLPPAPLVSACVVTHLTSHPYHKDRMEVVKLCLDTMIAGLQGTSYELLIWDNDSTPEFRAMLEAYNPDVLVKSKNVGGHNGRRNLAEIARGELLAQADDDVIFHPSWLEMQLEVLTTFPNVGIVSGSPYRWAFAWGSQPTETLPKEVKITRGKLLPEQWIKDACASVGQDYHASMWGLKDIDDVVLEYNGVKAFGHAHHLQFLGKRELVTPFLFRSPYLLANGRKFNEDIMGAGHLQLTTFRRSALHVGNLVDPRIKEIYREWYGKDWVYHE